MTPVALLLALVGPSNAFAPSKDVFTGIEPQRVRVEHGPVQAAWIASPPFQRFVAEAGTGWQARFDEATGTPRTMWGGGIAIPAGSGPEAAEGVAQVLRRHHELFGFEPSDLQLRSARLDVTTDTWYIDFDALREGLPTYRGGISARVSRGNLVLLHVATSPHAAVEGAFHLDADEAIARAIAGGPAPAAKHTDASAEPILLEQSSLSGMRLVETFAVRTRTADPPGIWVTFVDAATGELLSVHNEVRFIAGTVQGEHHVRTLDGTPLVQSPLPLVFVDGDVDSDLTDALGDYDVTAGLLYATDLHGDYVDIDNDAGSDAVISSDSPDIVWTDADATQAEIDSYVFINQVKLWGERVAPTNPWPNIQFESHVNVDSTCNAFWDGDTHFFRAGDGCNNTGQIADVNYHEWGHGFHYYSILAGIFDGSLSEGAADVVAFFQTGDNRIAPYFGTNGSAIRDVAPNRVYPQDFVANDYYVHENGLIFGGAMWDLRDGLMDELGEVPGLETAEAIFAGLLKGGTDIPGTFAEALEADDDDGNLANGTPHQCAIIDAFGQHGLGMLFGGSTALLLHEPFANAPADVPTPITVGVSSIAPDCIEVVPDTGIVHYRVDKGPWREVEATIDGGDVEADIPAQPYGTFVEYWVDGDDTAGDPYSAPTAGQFAPYTYFVGETLEIRCDDFEADDGGFHHTLVDGDDSEGADDWQRGLPAGAGGDPAAAFSGSKVWGNDLGHDNFNGLYQPDKFNRLRSQTVETGHYTEVFLQYRRWLNIEDGFYDHGLITANDEVVWENWGSDEDGGENHQDTQWVSHSVDLKGIGDRGELQIGWELHSDGGLEFGGWTIDDVCILAPATPDNRLGITDFVATDDGGPTEFSWTNPIHRPVERVVVVRNTERWPASWDDGSIVLDVAEPVPGEVVEGFDPNLDGKAGFYAVYASDGDNWLSWTIEGWNAAQVASGVATGLPNGDGGGDGDGAIAGEGGCGCSDAPTPATGLPVGLAALLLTRRRRRA
jgi:hypothetical protein